LGQPISPIFSGQTIQEECWECLDMQLYREWCGQGMVHRHCFTLWDGTIR